MATVLGTGTVIRPPQIGDGVRLAELWRELWIGHEPWGGYPSERREEVYVRIAEQLDATSGYRNAGGWLGSHLHLVAERDGEVVGQVEGWIVRAGGPHRAGVCDLRSLVVSPAHRKSGVASQLIRALRSACARLGWREVVISAEVLERNPARRLYERLGFLTSAITLRSTQEALRSLGRPCAARRARARDAWSLLLAQANRTATLPLPPDLAVDGPIHVEAGALEELARRLESSESQHDGDQIWVAASSLGRSLAATVRVQRLWPPFVEGHRVWLCDFVWAANLRGPLSRSMPVDAIQGLIQVALGRAASLGAACVELREIPVPWLPSGDTLGHVGLEPWSRSIVQLGKDTLPLASDSIWRQ